jgi:hypothetical protein
MQGGQKSRTIGTGKITSGPEKLVTGPKATHDPTIACWQVRAADFPATASRSEQLSFLLRYAILAPSLHNTQPWLFAVLEDGFELYADRTRALPVIDPEDRELTIGCGAALLNLRVALRAFGYEEEVDLFPDPADGDLLARIRVRLGGSPTSEDMLLFRAIPQRHTNRQPFAPRAVPAALALALEGEADDEGAWLCLVKGEHAQMEIAELIRGAELMLWQDRRYRRELAAWMHPRRRRYGDGIPGYARGLADLESFLGPAGPHTRAGEEEVAELGQTLPLLAVLGTDGDSQTDRVAAGQALERVLLRAQADGVTASFLSQPVELQELRPRLRELLGHHGFPQLVVRLGFGPSVKPTPRRPLSDVLLT